MTFYILVSIVIVALCFIITRVLKQHQKKKILRYHGIKKKNQRKP